VFVGGEPTGLKTPTTLSGITQPQLSVRVELANHAQVSRVIDIAPGTTASTQFALAALQGRLVISGLSGGASVVVDTQEFDAGEVIPLTAGKHDIRIVQGGKVVAQQSIETGTGDQVWKLVQGKLVRN